MNMLSSRPKLIRWKKERRENKKTEKKEEEKKKRVLERETPPSL